MSYLTTQPEAMDAAAAALGVINANSAAADAAAAGPTTAVVPPAADEVSALTAAQFVAQAQMYQAVSAQAQEVQNSVASTLSMSGKSYEITEIANALAQG